MEFAAAFRAQFPPERVQNDALEHALAHALRRARDAWPTLVVDPARFAERLAQLVQGAVDLADALEQLDVGELYFTFACASGEVTALATLDRTYFSDMRWPLAKMGLDATSIDETLQMMREELLTRRDDREPRILNYAGRGHFHGWLRSVAARTGLRLIRKNPRHDEIDDRTRAPIDDDLELAYMKKTYGEVFQSAFRTARDGLDAKDRLLLKQRFRHAMTVEELGGLYGVHAGTISRRVAAARERLVDATRTEMMRALGVEQAELASIMRLIESEMDITLSSISPPSGT